MYKEIQTMLVKRTPHLVFGASVYLTDNIAKSWLHSLQIIVFRLNLCNKQCSKVCTYSF